MKPRQNSEFSTLRNSKKDSSTSTSETSENLILFVFISSFVFLVYVFASIISLIHREIKLQIENMY